MCGLLSVISKNYNKSAIDIFKQMLFVGTLRGWDGAGIFKVALNNVVTVVKQPGPAVNLLNYINKPPETNLFGNILVGHNRASTKGANTEANTHPFKEKQITLVHNGTIYNHLQLEKTEVDSHAICHYLTEHTPQELVNIVNGAYALVWYDSAQETLFFMRNKERPLYIVHTKDLTVLASESEMAEWIILRNGIDVHDVEEVTPFTLYSISARDLHKINKRPLKEPEKTIFVSVKKKEEKVEELKIPKNKKDKVLPATTKATQAILESLENRGLKKNDVFTAYCYSSEALGESYKNFAIADFDMQEEVVFYSRISFEGENVSLIFKNLVDDVANNSYYLFGTAVQIQLKDDVKQTANGVPITEEVDKFLQGKACSSCGGAYIKTDAEFGEIESVATKDGFVYKYTYTCPLCVE